MKELSIPEKIKNNPELFKGKKVIVIGDIALDHSYYCRPSQKGFHAIHAGEEIFDIEPWGDDRGVAGSAYNICVLANSLYCDSILFTVAGKDYEGRRVKEYLKENDQKSSLIQLEGIQTVTRIRSFVYNETSGAYDLRFRMDKEPDYELSYTKSLKVFKKKKFLSFLESEIRSCSALIIDDTEKGFVSREIVEILSGMIEKENTRREQISEENIVTLIDPKNNWSRFAGLPGAIIKPNLKETFKELNIAPESFNIHNTETIKELAGAVLKQFGKSFSKYIVTLGRDGALLLDIQDSRTDVYLVSPVRPGNNKPGLSAHCGDVFGAALALGLTLRGEDIFSSLAFAAWAASLQFCKQKGEKISLNDLKDESNYQNLVNNYQPCKFICKL